MDADKEMEEQFKVLTEHRECLEWILGKQAELRGELLAFFKKDIKEITSAISDLQLGEDAQKIAGEMVQLVKTTFLEQWKRSFDLISPEVLAERVSAPVAEAKKA